MIFMKGSRHKLENLLWSEQMIVTKENGIHRFTWIHT